MAKAKITKLLASTALMLSVSAASALATEIETNTARLQAMNKMTGKVSVIDVPVNGEVEFGSFSIVARACKTRPPEETPDNYAFIDVVDNLQDNTQVNIFKGWMISSSPALNAIEHPIYDVWLLQCVDGKVDKSKLLSAEKLKARDEIVRPDENIEAETETPAEANGPESLLPEAVSETPADTDTQNVPTETQPNAASSEADVSAGSEVSVQLPISDAVQAPENAQEAVDDGAPQSLINIPADIPVAASVDEVPVATETVPAEAVTVEQVSETVIQESNSEPTAEAISSPAPASEAVVPDAAATVVPEAQPASDTVNPDEIEDGDEQLIEFDVEEENTVPEINAPALINN